MLRTELLGIFRHCRGAWSMRCPLLMLGQKVLNIPILVFSSGLKHKAWNTWMATRSVMKPFPSTFTMSRRFDSRDLVVGDRNTSMPANSSSRSADFFVLSSKMNHILSRSVLSFPTPTLTSRSSNSVLCNRRWVSLVCLHLGIGGRTVSRVSVCRWSGYSQLPHGCWSATAQSSTSVGTC